MFSFPVRWKHYIFSLSFKNDKVDSGMVAAAHWLRVRPLESAGLGLCFGSTCVAFEQMI